MGIHDQLPFILFLLLGTALWMLATWFEGRTLRQAWHFLAHPEAPEDRNGKREVLLDRTTTALSATRLGRILATAILPVCLLLPMEASLADWLSESGDPFTLEVLAILGIGIALALVMETIRCLYLARFYDRAMPTGHAPEWLTDPTHAVPPPAAAAAILWDWLFRLGESLSRMLGIDRQKAYLFERGDQLMMAIGEAEVETFGAHRKDEVSLPFSLDRTERDMIRSIQRLDKTLAREVMRPLNKVTAVNLSNTTPVRFLALARRTGYTRFPCYYDQVTNLIGYLNVHDVLGNTDASIDLRTLVHEAIFVPEVARLDAVLEEMLRRKTQIAICFDEFGGCSGLVSREDIIEEITGEIMDEYDRVVEIKCEARRGGDYLVDGSIDLDDLSEAVGLHLEKRNCDTLAGYVYHRLSRAPRRGETLEERGWQLEIVHMDRHRIQKIRLVPPAAEHEDVDD